MPGNVLGAQEHALKVDAEHRVPVIHRGVDNERHQVADAGIVDQEVDPAERLDGVRHHRRDLVFEAHVARLGTNTRAGLRTDRRRDPLHLLTGADAVGGEAFTVERPLVRQHNRRTLRRQPTGHRLAKPVEPAGAGDNGDPAVETTCHAKAPLPLDLDRGAIRRLIRRTRRRA